MDRVQLRNLFDFTDLSPVVVPAVRPEQQLAEKLHAYTRDYGDRDNSRAKDLYDLLAIAQHLTLPPLGQLQEACRVTFALRATAWPPVLAPPPGHWSSAWQGFVRDYGIAFSSLDDAYAALGSFWTPILAATSEDHSNPNWDADTWSW